MQLSSTDYVDVVTQNTSTVLSNEAMQVKRAQLGLDKHFIIQYFDWIQGLLKGDMGVSFATKQNVFDMLLSKLPNTILLAFFSLILTFLISIPLGIYSAINKNKFADGLIKIFCFMGNSIPNFTIGFILIYIFAVKLEILNVISENSLEGLILPSLALAIAMSSKYTRQIRNIVIEEYNKDYVMGLRARGISQKDIITRSVLKSTMITILTLVSLSLGSLLGGTAIIESIFMWDGMGKMAIDAVMMKDYPVVQGYVLFMAFMYVIVNLVTDILYHYIDPRVRKSIDE